MPPPVEQELDVANFPELPALVHYVRQKRCALFVGAGLSVGAGLPTWRALMDRLIPAATPFALTPGMLEELEQLAKATAKAYPKVENPLSQLDIERLFTRMLGQKRSHQLFDYKKGGINICYSTAYHEALNRVRRDSAVARELEKLLGAGKFPELAGYCRDLLGRHTFHELVRKELRLKREIPETHQAIVRTSFSCIVTTNFDSLIEDAYARWDSRGVPKAPTGAELAQQGTLLFDGSFFILKAHGDLGDESSIIFTSEDYRRVIHSNPAFQAILTGILLRHAVLFVGYSLSDPNFRLLLDNQLTIFNEQVPPRYALMEGVGEAEREILWRTAKLRVFSYEKGKHEVVRQFLCTLANRSASPAVALDGTEATRSRITKRVLLRLPAPLRVFELAIKGSGERIILQLAEHVPGKSPQRIWSGGCQWPDWPTLRYSLKSLHSLYQVDLPTVSAIGAQLQSVMPDDLLHHMNLIPSDTTITLSLSPETETIPWEWLIVEGSPFCLRNPVVRRPTTVSDRARGLRLAGESLRALVIGDAGIGDNSNAGMLPGAAQEAKNITELLRRNGHHVTSLEQGEAIYARVVTEVEQGDYDIIHFAGHAWFEQSLSMLYFWDTRVSSSELASILNLRPPALLMLNSHYTGFVPCGVVFDDYPRDDTAVAPGVDRPLPPPLGFMGLASRSGVGAFVGCFGGHVQDDSASDFAIALYKQLLKGAHFAAALHSARKLVTKLDDPTALCYVGSGYPELLLSSSKLILESSTR
jgi:hypothetical protein